jgi:LysM repeat protein
LLAPLSLIGFVVAFAIVLSSSSVHKHGAGTAQPATSTTGATTTARPGPKPASHRSYTVKAGDTLGAIAIRTGVTVTALEDLNPGLDPQGLVAGQKIKLR